jgi:ABC-type phosphate/phosphonate transport system substrate-binding protein
LMKDLTGFNGKGLPSGDAFDVGKKLEDKTLHLGVFQGFEYAWAKQRYPNLQPLMIAVYYNRHLQAHIVVKADAKETRIVDLKGKDIAVPVGSKGHSKLFVQREVAACAGCEPKAFFKQVTKPVNIEDGLDAVCSGTVDAMVVDNVSFEGYQNIKPGCAKRLRKLKDSEIFPAAVIAYRDGVFGPGDLDKFKTGMRTATNTAWGKQLMQIMKITAFENIPDDYSATVANILRVYPPPAVAPSTKTSAEQ